MQDEKLKLEDLLEKTFVASDGNNINSVVIIGAGIMGQGIAQTVAAAGMDVLIVEKDEKHLRKSKSSLAESIDREIKRWAMTASEKKSIMSRISWGFDLDKINDYDLIIEAVDEDYELKRSIFKKLDQAARKDIIFVSNTSTLSLTKIAEVTHRQEKIIGMHFLNPVPKVPVVEIIKCLNTSNKTVEMADMMGLDEVLAWMETLWKTLGEPRYRACPILRKLVREKKLGRKTGEGFYKYDENGKIISD